MSGDPSGLRAPSKAWLPAIMAVGLVAGAILSLWASDARLELFGVAVGPREELLLSLHIILATVGIALLVALLAVYAEIYGETRARFAFGVVLVIIGLLAQGVFEYPLLLGLAGPFEAARQVPQLFADSFTVAAYAVFLYLSLE